MILLKRSLTIWLFPIYLISFLFSEITIFDEYIVYIGIMYVIIIILNYLKNNLLVLAIDRVILMYLSFLVFVNNKTITDKTFLISIILSLCIVFVYVIAFFIYKRRKNKFVLNFSKLMSFIEFILAIFVLCFGYKNFIIVNILFVAMIDIFYKVLILSIIINLKKRFSIQ